MSSNQNSSHAELEKLDDTDLILDDDAQDVRGRKLIDQQGETIGHVSSLFIDADERKVRMLEVRAGGFLGIGDRHFLIPADAVTKVEKESVYVNESRERILHSPVYDPHIIKAPTREYWGPFYGYYGLSPYWGTDYMYPGFPLSLEETPVRDEHSIHARDI
jgi:sporulation protein YlmC with PRC-barrel domain